MSEPIFPACVWWEVLDSIGSDDGHVLQVQRYQEHYCLKVEKPDRSAVIIPIKWHHAEYLLAAMGALFRDFMVLEGVTMTVETRPVLKPDLYVDVDGVLFGLYNGAWQLRPDVVPFLRWCIGAFNCYWLTAWPKARLDVLFSCLMAPDLRSIQEVKRTTGKDGKAGDINYCHNFYWIEDAILDDERQCLERHQVMDRYIPVNHEGRDELDRVWVILREKVEVNSDE